MAATEFEPKSIPFNPSQTGRHAGLEWFRAGMTLAVVLLHAGMAYLTRPFPGLVWSTHDAPSAWADVICWTANAFVMPAFFLLGGYGSAALLRKLGPSATAEHRLKRLGGPLLLGCVLILPLDLYAWLLGWAGDGTIPLKKLRSLKFDAGVDDGLWGVSHLWFLEYLLLFGIGLAAWRVVRPALPERWAQRIVSTPGLLTLATFTTGPLWMDPQILLGFRHTWLPQPWHIAFFLPMFLFGVLWSRVEGDRLGVAHVLAGGLWLAATSMGRHAWLDAANAGLVAPGVIRLVAVSGYSFAGWLIAAGMFGVCRRLKWSLPRPVAYFTAASFWVYLFHHPVVGLTQAVLKPLDWSSDAKFVATTAMALWLSLGTFEVAIRRTWVGRVLGVPQASRHTVEDKARVEQRVAA